LAFGSDAGTILDMSWLMKARHLLLGAAVMLLTTGMGCEKDKASSGSDPDLAKLYGSWNWVQSSGGFAGETTTPATAGYTMTVEFSPNGIYKWYKNNQLQGQAQYSMTTGNSIFSTEQVNQLQVEGSSTKQAVRFGGPDSLFLNDECYDCYGHIYTRK
jgi:hypothetical protein